MDLRLQSAFGLLAMVGLAWLLGGCRPNVRPRVIVGGLALQFAFAALALKTGPGRAFFDAANDVANAVLGCVEPGTVFVFGPGYAEHYFAFRVLASIVFFSALMAVLHHWRVVPVLVRAIGGVMRTVMGTGGAESLAAAANIFVGQSEALFVVRPYLARMTPSELTSVMVTGFATVAGGVMVAYIEMGVSAGHLVTASVISAPAALLIAKVIRPEEPAPSEGTPAAEPAPVDPDPPPDSAVNTLDVAAAGAADGVRLAINIGAQIIAFLGLIALADLFLGLAGRGVGQEWTLAAALGYGGAPLAWLMGVPNADCLEVGRLIGLKTVANEFLAYADLTQMPDDAIAERSRTIATYALCGFANFGSVGIQLGGLSLLAPSRRPVIAALAFRAMLGGSLAAFMTACVAGILV